MCTRWQRVGKQQHKQPDEHPKLLGFSFNRIGPQIENRQGFDVVIQFKDVSDEWVAVRTRVTQAELTMAKLKQRKVFNRRLVETWYSVIQAEVSQTLCRKTLSLYEFQAPFCVDSHPYLVLLQPTLGGPCWPNNVDGRLLTRTFLHF